MRKLLSYWSERFLANVFFFRSIHVVYFSICLRFIWKWKRATYRSLRLGERVWMLPPIFPVALPERVRSRWSKNISTLVRLQKRSAKIYRLTFIQLVFVGSKRPLNVTVSSMCGDNDPVMFNTGILSVATENQSKD